MAQVSISAGGQLQELVPVQGVEVRVLSSALQAVQEVTTFVVTFFVAPGGG